MQDPPPNPLIYSPPAAAEPRSKQGSVWFSALHDRTYTFFLFFTTFFIGKKLLHKYSVGIRIGEVEHVLSPKYCSPALARINNGLLCLPWLKPSYPGSKGWNLIQLISCEHPPPHTPAPQKNALLPMSYVCELHSYETLKLLRSQGTKTDFTSHPSPNTNYAFKGEKEKEGGGNKPWEAKGGKKTIRLT